MKNITHVYEVAQGSIIKTLFLTKTIEFLILVQLSPKNEMFHALKDYAR